LSRRNALSPLGIRADDDAGGNFGGAERLARLVFGFEMVHEARRERGAIGLLLILILIVILILFCSRQWYESEEAYD
jgi:hypothetical protein